MTSALRKLAGPSLDRGDVRLAVFALLILRRTSGLLRLPAFPEQY